MPPASPVPDARVQCLEQPDGFIGGEREVAGAHPHSRLARAWLDATRAYLIAHAERRLAV